MLKWILPFFTLSVMMDFTEPSASMHASWIFHLQTGKANHTAEKTNIQGRKFRKGCSSSLTQGPSTCHSNLNLQLKIATFSDDRVF